MNYRRKGQTCGGEIQVEAATLIERQTKVMKESSNPGRMNGVLLVFFLWRWTTVLVLHWGAAVVPKIEVD